MVFYNAFNSIEPLPKLQILGSSNLKDFADDNFQFWW